MELCAKACQKGLYLANQSGRSPGSEIAPMGFGVFPKNLDEIEFWSAGRQIEQEEMAMCNLRLDFYKFYRKDSLCRVQNLVG